MYTSTDTRESYPTCIAAPAARYAAKRMAEKHSRHTCTHTYQLSHTPKLCNLRSAMTPAQIGGDACKRPRADPYRTVTER
jgi:hypothetical protein